MIKLFGHVSKLIYTIMFGYTTIAMSIFDSIFNPIINKIENQSPTVAKSIENTLLPIYKFLLTLPIFIPVLTVSMIVIGDYSVLSTNFKGINIKNIISLTFIALGFSTTFTMKYIYNKDNKSAISLGLLTLTGAALIQFINPPYLYVHLIALIYTIGAYSTTVLEFKFEQSVNHILKEKEPQHDGMGLMLIYTIVVGGLMWLINNPIINSVYFVGFLVSTLGVTAYWFTIDLEREYKTVYNHLRPEKSSRKFLLPSRIAIVYATGFAFISLSIDTLTAILFLVPPVMFFSFSRYLTKEDGKKIKNENRSNIRKSQHNKGRKPDSDLDVDYSSTSTDSENKAAKITFEVDVEIPEKMKDNKDIWFDFIKTADNINNIIRNLETVDNTDEDIESYPKFYNHLSQIVYEEMVNNNVSLDELENLPTSVKKHMRENIHNNENCNMRDISDMDLIGETVEIENAEFFSNIPEDSKNN